MLLFAFLPAKLKLAKSDIALFCMMTPQDKIVSRTNTQKEPFPPILQLILYLSLSFNLSRFSPALLNERGAHTEGVRFLGQGCAVSGDRPVAGWNSSTMVAVLGCTQPKQCELLMASHRSHVLALAQGGYMNNS